MKETLVCHAIIGKNLSKERIMQVPIRCQFITPLIKTSRQNIHFQLDKDVNDRLQLQKDKFDIENCSTLPLSMNLRTTYPYSICEEGIRARNNCFDFFF